MSTQPSEPSSAFGRATGASDRAPRPAPEVLDALNLAIFQRKTRRNKGLIHHSDCGSQYLSITCTERLADAGIDPSVGTVGDSYDNALAECGIGLFKTEVINALWPWKTMRDVEWQTLKWIEWCNNRRLLAPIGYIPPAEAEQAYFANLNTLDPPIIPGKTSVLVVVEVGLITPPVGMNLFIINAMAGGAPLSATFRGAAPFVLSDIARVCLLVAFPAITLGLVRALF